MWEPAVAMPPGNARRSVAAPPAGTPLGRLTRRLSSNTAHLGVIGLGYVGLPLAVEFANAGFPVTGIDLDPARVASVNQGRSYVPDVPAKDLAPLIRRKRLVATSSYDGLSGLDVVIICVPTPLRKTREPDISFILAAAKEISRSLRRGQLIVLESTTYPGTTDEVILPMLQAGGLRAGKDFWLAFSPERIDPGNQRYTTRTIPKVVGGITPACRRLAMTLYRRIVEQVVPVSSTKVAEMVKLLENTFRAVNIGLVNEIALMCDKLGVEVWEVIEAAKTKPFGFMAFYPGPGIGGHCIPSDPMYLAWKARLQGGEARFIELADQTNRAMPRYVVEKVARALNDRRKPLNGSRVLLIGLAYKRDVNDIRDSPAFEIAQALQDRGAVVQYHDPYVAGTTLAGTLSASVPLSAARLKRQDAVVVLTNHSAVDYALILRHAPLIVDTRNQFSRLARPTPRVVKL